MNDYVPQEVNIYTDRTAKDFYSQGKAFNDAAWRCYGKKDGDSYLIMQGSETYQLAAPCVVNASFACEMYLKALLIDCHIDYKHEHNLYNLFELIPQKEKVLICRICSGTDDMDSFISVLKEHSDDFCDTRYFIENAGYSGMSPSKMTALSYNLGVATEYILSYKEKEDKK